MLPGESAHSGSPAMDYGSAGVLCESLGLHVETLAFDEKGRAFSKVNLERYAVIVGINHPMYRSVYIPGVL